MHVRAYDEMCVLPLAFSSTFTDSFFPTRVAFYLFFSFLSAVLVGMYWKERAGQRARIPGCLVWPSIQKKKKKNLTQHQHSILP